MRALGACEWTPIHTSKLWPPLPYEQLPLATLLLGLGHVPGEEPGTCSAGGHLGQEARILE